MLLVATSLARTAQAMDETERVEAVRDLVVLLVELQELQLLQLEVLQSELVFVYDVGDLASREALDSLESSTRSIQELSELLLEIGDTLLFFLDAGEVSEQKSDFVENQGLQWEDASDEGVDRSVYRVDGVEFALLLAPAAQFPHGNLEHPAHVHRDFWIAETEVTYALWYVVRQWAESRGYVFASLGQEGSHESERGASPTASSQEPVTRMLWSDALVWCNALSEMVGLQPVYFFAGDVMRNSLTFLEGDGFARHQDNDGFRLPTEEEWSLAARYNGTHALPGLTHMDNLYWYPGTWASGAASSDMPAVDDVAWTNANARQTQPVAQLRPNALGLYDMSGNVTEWIFYQYGHIVYTRGGGYFHGPNMVGVGYPAHNYPITNAYEWVGFRLARSQQR